MTRARGKLLALLAVFAAIGLATATGAFSSVEADRTATVNVAGDQAALLQLNPVSGLGSSDGGAGDQDFVDYENGQITFRIDQINTDAETDLGFVFEVVNTGEDTVGFYVDDTELHDGQYSNVGDNDVIFYRTLEDDPDNAEFGDGNGKSIESVEGDNSINIEPGESLKIGIKLNTEGADVSGSTATGKTFLSGELRIVADQSVATETPS